MRLRHGFHEDMRAVGRGAERQGRAAALAGPIQVGPAAVTQVHFYVNDVKAFVAAARDGLATVGS